MRNIETMNVMSGMIATIPSGMEDMTVMIIRGGKGLSGTIAKEMIGITTKSMKD